jgi:hypothetical protein
MQNTAAFRESICIHRGESSTMAGEVPPRLDLLLLDGDHSYAGVKSDLALYVPKLNNGGFLLLHDYVRPEVRQACEEFLATIHHPPSTIHHPPSTIHHFRDMGLTYTLQVFQLASE